MGKLTSQYKNSNIPASGNRAADADAKAAFFDVDGTLIRGDSQDLEARYCLTRSGFSGSYLKSIFMTLAALQLNRLGWISLTRLNETYLKSYKGKPRKELARQAESLFDQVIGRHFFSGALDLVAKHRQQGDLIVLISATTCHLMAPFQACLNPHYIYCTELEFDLHGRCTGQALDGICAEEKKAAIVRAFAGRHNIDLSFSHTYSDHHGDLPFLSAAGNPAVINPTRRLAKHARAKKWPIFRFY